MKVRVVCRKPYDYVRYDLKEIAFPSSLPDPPGTKRRPKLTLKEKWCILKEATRLYGASWVRDIGPELRPNDYKKAKEDSGPSSTEEGKRMSEPTVLEDLAVAARGGAETLKPALSLGKKEFFFWGGRLLRILVLHVSPLTTRTPRSSALHKRPKVFPEIGVGLIQI